MKSKMKSILMSIVFFNHAMGMEQKVEPVEVNILNQVLSKINLQQEVLMQDYIFYAFKDYRFPIGLALIDSTLGILNETSSSFFFSSTVSTEEKLLTREVVYVGNLILLQWLRKINDIQKDASINSLIKLLEMNIKYEPIDIKDNEKIKKVAEKVSDQYKKALDAEKKEVEFKKSEIESSKASYEIRKLKLKIVNILLNVELDNTDQERFDKYPSQTLEDKFSTFLNEIVAKNKWEAVNCLQTIENDYMGKYKVSPKLLEKIQFIIDKDHILQRLKESKEKKEKQTLDIKIEKKICFLKTALETLKKENYETVVMEIKNELEVDTLETVRTEIQNTYLKDSVEHIIKNIARNLGSK